MNIVRDIVVIGAGLGCLSAIAKIASTWPEDLPVSVLIALTTPDQPAKNVLQIIDSYAPVGVIFSVMRAELVMDIVFVSKQAGDGMVVSDSTDTHHVSVEGTFHPEEQSLCQCVLEGHQPGVIPGVPSLRLTHDA